jgi:hypothetical protein
MKPSRVPHREQISVELSTRLVAPGKAPGCSFEGIIPPQIGQNGISLLTCSQVMKGDFASHPPGEFFRRGFPWLFLLLVFITTSKVSKPYAARIG